MREKLLKEEVDLLRGEAGEGGSGSGGYSSQPKGSSRSPAASAKYADEKPDNSGYGGGRSARDAHARAQAALDEEDSDDDDDMSDDDISDDDISDDSSGSDEHF